MFLRVFFDFINTFAIKHKQALIALAVLSLIAAGIEFLGLSFIYNFVLSLSEKTPPVSKILNFSDPIKNALMLGILTALVYILKDIFMIFYTKYQTSILTNLTNTLFKTSYSSLLLSVSLPKTRVSLSDKIKILDESINCITWNFINKILILFANFAVSLSIIGYLFYKFRTDALILGGFILCIFLLENIYFKYQAKKYGPLTLEAKRKKLKFITSTVEASREALIYNKADQFTQIASKLQFNCTNYHKRIVTNDILPVYFTEIGVMSALAILIVLLMLHNTTGGAIVAALATLAAVVLRIVPAINRIQSCLHSINAYKSETLWFIDTYKSLIKHKEQEALISCSFKESILLKDISFSYDGNKKVLDDINLEIIKGDFIGITGPSGSGKSTLFNIICGFLKAQSGEILADEEFIDIKTLRRHISILPQEFCLPFDTIAQNVTLDPYYNGEEDAKVIQALKDSMIYDELLGDLARNVKELSSGQKQRIAIARAFYFERDIIMFDEATSSLDNENEEKISRLITNLKGKKTIIAIAHRINTLNSCDKIISLKQGKISEIKKCS